MTQTNLRWNLKQFWIGNTYSIFLRWNDTFAAGYCGCGGGFCDYATIWCAVRLGTSPFKKTETENWIFFMNKFWSCPKDFFWGENWEIWHFVIFTISQRNTHNPRDFESFLDGSIVAVCKGLVNGCSAGELFAWIFFSALANRSRSLSFFSIAVTKGWKNIEFILS